MRVSIPLLGNLHIALRPLFERLGVDYIIPPPNSRKTMSLGARYGPEGLCIPFKLTLGNMIEAAEMGADTMVQVGGYGTCRLGYYAKVQEQVLRELGYDFEMVLLGVSERKLVGFLQTIKKLAGNAPWRKIIPAFRFGLCKLHTLDRVERLAQKNRPLEAEPGVVNRLYRQAVTDIDNADGVGTLHKIEAAYSAGIDELKKREHFSPLIVGITGEFYVVLEPFSNHDVEQELGLMGVEVRRKTFISDWTKFSWFLNPLGVNENERIHRAALPYLKRDIGGDGWETVGEKVLHAGTYDGIVHLAPFTCMPEIIAQNIMPSTREHIPVMTVICDEQLAKPGVQTRLEAFVDLLRWRRNNNGRISESEKVSLDGNLSRN